ncbi:tail fiber assembly protein [Serratia ureilytica]|uniref:tail fiber assembly protein n=1 Tax=Serratia ureilytica TaxID=300181 RepID=UPI00370FCFA2
MTTYYSPSQNVAYPQTLMDAYEAAGTIPDDLVEISEGVFMEYFINPSPLGKYREAGNDGYPAWANTPSKTKETIIAEAESRRQNLLAEATVMIAPLQDAVELSIATDEEFKKYSEWRKYRVLLSRVDTENAPDCDWPKKPE